MRRARQTNALGATRQTEFRIHTRVLGPNPPVVLTGPFRGMRYQTAALGSAYWPKVLGTYECCLHPELEALIVEAPSTLINVGSGEGYYAVGFALRLPNAQVIASDVDPRARQLCRALSKANHVNDRVRVTCELTATDLEHLVGPNSALLMDIEGAETRLLRPDLAPSLTQTTILVELHDRKNSTPSAEIIRRFANTHTARLIQESEPDLHELTNRLARLSPDDRRHVLCEYRPQRMQWALLQPQRTALARRQRDRRPAAGRARRRSGLE